MIEIKKEFVLDAYRNASDSEKELLRHLFGNEVFKPVDVRDRIKTFADAAKAVGIEDPEEWEKLYSNLELDILAYFKLRIITKALNEDWEPKFVPREYRYAHGGKGRTKTQAEIGVMWLQAKERHGLPPPPEARRESSMGQILHQRFQKKPVVLTP